MHSKETNPSRPSRCVVRGPEQVGGPADVVEREREEELLRVARARSHEAPDLVVVTIGARDRLGEDRGVRGHAGHGVVGDQRGERRRSRADRARACPARSRRRRRWSACRRRLMLWSWVIWLLCVPGAGVLTSGASRFTRNGLALVWTSHPIIEPARVQTRLQRTERHRDHSTSQNVRARPTTRHEIGPARSRRCVKPNRPTPSGDPPPGSGVPTPTSRGRSCGDQALAPLNGRSRRAAAASTAAPRSHHRRVATLSEPDHPPTHQRCGRVVGSRGSSSRGGTRADEA